MGISGQGGSVGQDSNGYDEPPRSTGSRMMTDFLMDPSIREMQEYHKLAPAVQDAYDESARRGNPHKTAMAEAIRNTPSATTYPGGCPRCGRSTGTHSQDCAVDKHLREQAAQGVFADRREHPDTRNPRYAKTPGEQGD